MKKVLKILIPTVLVVALLATACWFFLLHDRQLTTNLLVSSAESMVSHGRYQRAITYYTWARKLSPNQTDIPLELADTYAASGNYTKAEYTLVSAISANPTDVQLYEALCRTYVAQDKLLDAVQMLDRITDESVKAQLDSHRPSAPVVTPESGYYTEYISVTAESPENKVYITVTGDYPANDDDLYTEPITLPAGESTVIALAVSADGLVSPAATFGYTIGGVVEEITLNDPGIDAAVREQLGLTAGSTLMTDELWSIASLELPETVTDLSDLVHFTALQTLSIQNISGMDFSVLRQLKNLQELNLSGCTISSNSLEAIGALTELRRLHLNSCALTDISALAQLTQLQELDLASNSISDVGVLSLMLELETVNLSNNPISSIAGLSTCSKLKSVDLSSCGINSIGSLSDKAQLETLTASNNQIVDLSPLANCTSLSELNVSNNLIVDISVLAQLPNLVTFLGDNNSINAIPDFDEANCKLVTFSANYNLIADISGLCDITTLNTVAMDYNQVTDISPLATSANLIRLDIWNNPIKDVDTAVKPFLDSSIIVNYNPNYEVPKETDSET